MKIPRTLIYGVTSRWRVVKVNHYHWVAVPPGLPVQLGVPHASHEVAIRYAHEKAARVGRILENFLEVCS